MPNTSRRPSQSFQPEIPRMMNIEDATIRPKKNAQVWIGKSLSSICISPARAMMLTPIPTTSESRKLPLMCFQKAANRPLSSSFTASPFIEASEPTNSSYIPIMKAIVPPDTPGMTSAAPIQAPFTATITFFQNPFILPWSETLLLLQISFSNPRSGLLSDCPISPYHRRVPQSHICRS